MGYIKGVFKTFLQIKNIMALAAATDFASSALANKDVIYPALLTAASFFPSFFKLESAVNSTLIADLLDNHTTPTVNQCDLLENSFNNTTVSVSNESQAVNDTNETLPSENTRSPENEASSAIETTGSETPETAVGLPVENVFTETDMLKYAIQTALRNPGSITIENAKVLIPQLNLFLSRPNKNRIDKFIDDYSSAEFEDTTLRFSNNDATTAFDNEESNADAEEPNLIVIDGQDPVKNIIVKVQESIEENKKKYGWMKDTVDDFITNVDGGVAYTATIVPFIKNVSKQMFDRMRSQDITMPEWVDLNNATQHLGSLAFVLGQYIFTGKKATTGVLEAQLKVVENKLKQDIKEFKERIDAKHADFSNELDTLKNEVAKLKQMATDHAAIHTEMTGAVADAKRVIAWGIEPTLKFVASCRNKIKETVLSPREKQDLNDAADYMIGWIKEVVGVAATPTLVPQAI